MLLELSGTLPQGVSLDEAIRTIDAYPFDVSNISGQFRWQRAFDERFETHDTSGRLLPHLPRVDQGGSLEQFQGAVRGAIDFVGRARTPLAELKQSLATGALNPETLGVGALTDFGWYDTVSGLACQYHRDTEFRSVVDNGLLQASHADSAAGRLALAIVRETPAGERVSAPIRSVLSAAFGKDASARLLAWVGAEQRQDQTFDRLVLDLLERADTAERVRLARELALPSSAKDMPSLYVDALARPGIGPVVAHEVAGRRALSPEEAAQWAGAAVDAAIMRCAEAAPTETTLAECAALIDSAAWMLQRQPDSVVVLYEAGTIRAWAESVDRHIGPILEARQSDALMVQDDLLTAVSLLAASLQ
ncbi:MAG: hypothetical protein IT384_16840 [Deltaproteobacteria bacterium]|nr:hypothetical protein [Deltaproteobacteria bacterium]